eukprot:CAMPEP_0114172222 /NCGR_PEP_ID=MMETSP0043_2-20121206/35138_1 /TAXON_ID=464988 /ORGANISM="Hemiselmis andersenii, Strain CCMP644" /LENGTH=251 /DNA_ID=CAMNT_0001270039 /DNA_START=258 /DNA_END=1010 /DNA_ORIENTATION=+
MQSIKGITDVASNRPELQGREVWIVRHAQGSHNVGEYEFDPELTAEGRRQVASQKSLSSQLPVDLVLVSPLRRTLETASGLFGKHPNMVAVEELRESVTESCNIRLPVSELKKAYPHVDFGGISEDHDPYLHRFDKPEGAEGLSGSAKWDAMVDAVALDPETDAEMVTRGEVVLKLLASRPEKTVALVSHAMFLNVFLHMQMVRGQPYRMYNILTNCEIRRLSYHDKGAKEGSDGPFPDLRRSRTSERLSG